MKLWVRVLRGLWVATLVLGGTVVGVTASSLAVTTIAVAQTASSIVVEGNRRVEADTIRSYFRGAAGDRLDAARIDAGLKALYATGLFEDIRINHAGGRLVITVVEAPVINRVAFEGNKKAKDDQLSAEIQSKSRGTLSRAVVQSDVQRIVEIYRRSGRYDVRVVPKIIDLPNNRVDLVFEITEGDKTAVKDIVFIGNKAMSNGRLKDVIKSESTGLLSFFNNRDVYDPDRVEADRELLRRFYLKHGYADVRIVSAVSEYDPAKKGFIVTFTIDEGTQYRVGTVDVQTSLREVNMGALRSRLRTSPGAVYNAEAVEKSVEDLTIEVSKQGYAFAQVRPRGDRNFETHQINIVFAIDEGQRAYIERINIRGNTRTRDYVIRREFDIAEGDAYNRVLVDRAERRLKNLNYFKTVKITNEPGSAPDRVVINVDVEEMSTGEFSIAGGYSTADGIIGEVSVAERNLLGRGQFAKIAAQFGQRTRGLEFSFVEPYLLGYRLSGGFDIYGKMTTASNYTSYDSKIYGLNLKLGLPLREDLTMQLRYSIYRQEISLPDQFKNCNNLTPNSAAGTYPTSVTGINPATGLPWVDPATGAAFTQNCYFDGEASLAVKQVEASGPAITSLVGYTLAYNTLDNNKLPTSGLYVEFKQDFAGVGGDVNFIRTMAEARYYYELMSDLVASFKLQGGYLTGWGNKDLRMLDHFFMGPGLVRGFAPSGLGPRDMTAGTNLDALGGTMYWGSSIELQTPILGLPKDFGVRLAVFADAGSLWGYRGPTTFTNGLSIASTDLKDDAAIRSSVGAGLIWDSPFGPLRIDYAYALTKQSYDNLQQIRFGGGTKF